MKAFITQSNLHRIIKNNELNNGKESYKYKGSILQFLSFGQLAYLNKYSIFIQELTKGEVNFFKRIKLDGDTYTKIFEGGTPAYHINSNCSKLHSDYKNYEIPLPLLEKLKKDYDLWSNQIKDISDFENSFYEKWKLKLPKDNLSNNDLVSFIWENEVKRFRSWFNNNSELFKKNEKEFNEKMYNDWGVMGFEKKYEYDNSGITEIENLTGLELEEFIDNKIKERSNYYNSLSNQEKQIINFLGKNVYLFKDINIEKEKEEEKFWNIIKDFHENYKRPKKNLDILFEGYNPKQIYELLMNYDKNYIEVIKRALLQYITIKLNPDLKFDSNILESLGFKKCGECGGK